MEVQYSTKYLGIIDGRLGILTKKQPLGSRISSEDKPPLSRYLSHSVSTAKHKLNTSASKS